MSEQIIIKYLAVFLAGLAGFLMARVLAPEIGPQLAVGGAGRAGRVGEKKHIFMVIFGSLIKAMGEWIAILPLGEKRNRLRKRLIQAGVPGGLSPDEYHAARIIGVVLAALCGLFIDDTLGSYPVFGLMLAAVGFIYPDIWLTGLIQKRRRRIFRDLPDTLDILRLAVDAGLDLSSAMKVVVEKGRRGPLMDELEKIERDMSLGMTRKDALKAFADRLAMTEINSFVLAIIQADQLGASIGPILKVQSEVARARRWQMAEVLVNKMPMKMLGPLVLFIFPASFIILFTPLIIQYMQSGQ